MDESYKRVKTLVLGVNDFTTFQSSDRALWHWNNCFGRGISSQNNMTILEVVMDTDNEIADNLAPGLSKSTVQKNKLRQKNKSNTTNVNKKFNISFDTQIAVLYASYRIVFAIDYSPSMRRIDHVSGKPFYSLLREKVSLFLRDLINKIEFRHSNTTFTPEIFISVIISWKRKKSDINNSHPVIIQGFSMSQKNVESLIEQLMQRLTSFERDEVDGSNNNSTYSTSRSNSKRNKKDESSKKRKLKQSGPALQETLNACLRALDKLLPDACPMVVLFTDGVVELPMVHDYESILMKLSRKDIPCHIVRIGTTDAPSSSWGCVSDPGTLLYLSRATGGVFFQGSSNISDNVVSYIHGNNDSCWRQKELLYKYSCLADGTERNMGVIMSSLSNGRGRTKTNRFNAELYNGKLLGVNVGPRYSDTPMYSGRTFGNLKKTYTSNMENTGVPGYFKLAENLPIGTMQWYQEYPVVNDLNLVKSMQAIDYPFPWAGPPPPSPCWKETIKEYKLLVNFERLLECRAWEGFCVTYTHTRDVLQLSDDSKSFEMTFTMPWKPGVDILYNICSDDVLNLATSSGPFKRTVEASIRVELIASVEFLRNFVRNTNEASGRKRYPRLHRFLNTIHEIDKVLVHLSSPPPLRELENKRVNLNRDGLKSIIGRSRSSSSSSSNKKTSTFFVIFGKLPLNMWNRWFCVEQVEAFVVGTTVFPKRQAKNLANILARWSTQRLSKDVHMKLLEVDDEEGTEEDDDDIEDFSLSNEMSGIQERSAGCAFCLTKCKWRSPTSVVVNIAFHAAKPTIRNTIKKHLSKNMLDSGFMIVTPYEQHVARSFYWDLINEKNEEKSSEELKDIYERVLKSCTLTTAAIVNDVPQVDTDSTFKKVVSSYFSPIGTIEDTFFLKSQNNDSKNNKDSKIGGVPFFLHVKYHEKTPRITLSCFTLPFDKIDAEGIMAKVMENMKQDFNSFVAEEILEKMMNETTFSQNIVSKMFDYLERTQKTSDLVTIVDHATTLGSDPIFVEALTKQTSWSIISPHVYKKNNMPYWVLLSVLDDDHTKIHIFGGGDDTNKEIENVISGIDNASKRAEQSSLLKSLFENRACSTDRLILADGSNGILACPSVLKVKLQLHQRVQVHVALRALAAIPVLRPFAIGNRPNCYVLSSTFYLRIEDDTEYNKAAAKKCLLLEVFGLGETGVDIKTDLVNMVKNKLKSVALGHLLRHNSLYLSVADLSLIQPLNSEPVHKFDIRLPTHLADINKFRTIFNQNARRLLMPLKLFRNSEAPILQLSTLTNKLILDSKSRRSSSSGKKFKQGIHAVENAYLVNGGSKTVANSNLSIGKGLAVMYFEFRKGKGAGSRRWSLPPWHHDGGVTLYIQIWSAGSVNLEKLYNLIEEFVEQAILTYALEDDFLLRKDGPIGEDMKILQTAYNAGVPDLFQWASKRLVPAWAKPTIIQGLANALEGVVVEEKKDGVFAMSTIIVRQPQGKLLQAVASVRSNGIQLWTYKWQDRKSLKVTIENMMQVVEENKHILDRCLETKMGVAQTPFYSEKYMNKWTSSCQKVEDIVGSHVSILMDENKDKQKQKEVERATLAILQTCKSNRQRVKGLPELRKVLNTYRIVKNIFTPLILINDAAAAAKAYARFLSSTLPIRRLRNRGDDAVLYGNFPDPVLFVVSGHDGLSYNDGESKSNTQSVLAVNVLILPGTMPAGPGFRKIVSTLRLQAWAYDTALIRIKSVTSGLSIRGAAEICNGLDNLISRYKVPPTGSKNLLQKHVLHNRDISLLTFISKNGDKYGCRGHSDGSIDFVLLSQLERDIEQVSGIVRNSTEGMCLYIVVRDYEQRNPYTPYSRCEDWLQKTFGIAQMDRRRDTFWNQAIGCQSLSAEAAHLLRNDAVELPMVDPTLNELLQSISETSRSDEGKYYVKHGLSDAMIYTGELWKKKKPDGKMSDNEKNLVESWVVDECIRLSLVNLK